MSQASLLQCPLSEPLPSSVSELHTHRAATHLPLLHCPPSSKARNPRGLTQATCCQQAPNPASLTSHSRLFFCLVHPFPFLLLILQSLPRGLSKGQSTRRRVWALSWSSEHVLAGHVTAGRDVAMCPLPSRDTEPSGARGSVCLVRCCRPSTQHHAQRSTTTNRAPSVDQAVLQVGIQGKNNMEKFLPVRGPHSSGRQTINCVLINKLKT